MMNKVYQIHFENAPALLMKNVYNFVVIILALISYFLKLLQFSNCYAESAFAWRTCSERSYIFMLFQVLLNCLL